MESSDVYRHLERYEAPMEDLYEMVTEGLENDLPAVKHLPCCAKVLVHDVIHFDVSRLDFLHKLGEGKKQLFSVMLSFSLIILNINKF